LARENPSLDVGCHLVLVGGKSLLDPYKPLPASVPRLIAAISSRQIRVDEELRAQVRAIQAAGIAITHLDTHKHTHLAPPVLAAVARVAEESGIRWVRRPFDAPITPAHGTAPWLTRATSSGLRVIRKRFQAVLNRHGCRTTDHFAGFQITGRLEIADLVRLLRALPEGLTELMCHPGKCGSELRQARTRLKQSRERELAALVAPETRQALAESGIELVNYRSVGRA
jgi:predicted glycoside hydrolase/deacetylase ChbG (UPF0249 family)